MPISRLLLFLTVLLSITAGVHYYIWARLVRDTALPVGWTRALTAILVGLSILIPVSLILTRVARRSLAAPLIWLGYVWLGTMFFVFVLLVFSEVFRRLSDIWLWWMPSGVALDGERRQLISRVLGSVTALGALGLAGSSLASGLGPVMVKRVRVSLAKIPQSLSGFTIVQLTDIHVGPTIGKEFIDRLVQVTNALDADVIAITGDLVDGSVEKLGTFVAPLANLRAKHGVFFVTGNHEYYSGADEWLAYLGTLGVRVLRNERVRVGGADGIDIGGVDDWSAHQFGNGHGMKIESVVADRDTTRPLVLLAHQPKAIVQAAAHDVDLQLSGHTHGGQLFPFNYLVQLEQPYVDGLHTHGPTKIYVSRGTGYWGPPMRLGAPAEITLLELVSADA